MLLGVCAADFPNAAFANLICTGANTFLKNTPPVSMPKEGDTSGCTRHMTYGPATIPLTDTLVSGCSWSTGIENNLTSEIRFAMSVGSINADIPLWANSQDRIPIVNECFTEAEVSMKARVSFNVSFKIDMPQGVNTCPPSAVEIELIDFKVDFHGIHANGLAGGLQEKSDPLVNWIAMEATPMVRSRIQEVARTQVCTYINGCSSVLAVCRKEGPFDQACTEGISKCVK